MCFTFSNRSITPCTSPSTALSESRSGLQFSSFKKDDTTTSLRDTSSSTYQVVHGDMRCSKTTIYGEQGHIDLQMHENIKK